MRGTSLHARLTAASAVILVVVGALVVTFLDARLRRLSEQWETNRLEGIAVFLSRSAAVGLDFDDGKGVSDLLEKLDTTPGAIYALVQRADQSQLAAWHPELLPKEGLPPVGAKAVTTKLEDALHAVVPIVGQSARGALRIGLSLRDAQHEQRVELMQVAGLVAAGIFVVLLVTSALVRLVSHPITELTKTAERITASGNLAVPLPAHATQEVNRLAQSFQKMLGWLRSLLSNVGELGKAVAGVTEQAARTGADVERGVSTVKERVERSTQAAEGMLTTLKDLEGQTEAVQQAVTNGSTHVASMRTTNTSLQSAVRNVATAAGETGTAILEMTTSITQTTRRMSELRRTIESTDEAIRVIHRSIAQVQDRTRTAAEVADLVLAEARNGESVLRDTTSGVLEMRDAAQTAVTVMTELDNGISQIDTILAVIREVSEGTNLLALNASIIAAQAGEHGRAFSVVADEVKGLASRTGGSVGEIAQIVQRVQSGAKRVSEALQTALGAVNEGARMAERTTAALKQIHDAAGRSQQMMRDIATETSSQSEVSRRVGDASHALAVAVTEVERAMHEQQRGAEQIRSTTERQNALTESVQASLKDQLASSAQVIEAFTIISRAVRELREAQGRQSEAVRTVLSSVESIGAATAQQTRSVNELRASLEALGRESARLSDQVAAYET